MSSQVANSPLIPIVLVHGIVQKTEASAEKKVLSNKEDICSNRVSLLDIVNTSQLLWVNFFLLVQVNRN